MKNAIFTFALIFAAITTNAQTFTALTASTGFNVETGEPTGERFNVDGKTFDIYETGKGSKYIKCQSAKTGSSYPVWIGKETEFEHDGRKVYQSKKGSYCIYKLSDKTGNPYPVWLRMQ